MTKFASFAAVLLFAACGGKSAGKPTAVHDESHEMQGSGSATASGDDHDDHADHDHADHDHADHDHEHAAGSAETPPPSQPDPAKVKAELVAAEQAAFDSAKPVFEKHCARCHKQGGAMATNKKLGHFNMTTYPFGGHHSATIGAEVREALGLTGEKPTMPADKKGAVKGDELALIAAWADAFDKSHAGGAHEGMGHDHDHEHGDDHKH